MSTLQFVKELPSTVVNKLTEFLNDDGKWEKVVKRFLDVNIKAFSVEELRQETYPSSPASKLLTALAKHNVRIWHLYTVGATLNFTNLMSCLEDYVDEEIRKKVEDKMRMSKRHLSKDAKITLIHQLPDDVRRQLCSILDADDTWRELYRGFACPKLDYYYLQRCKEQPSPSSDLLKIIGDRNFKISHLYLALASINHPKAMSILENYVSENLRDIVLSHLNKLGIQKDIGRKLNVTHSQDSQPAKPSAKNINEDTQSDSEYSEIIRKQRGYGKVLEKNITCESPLQSSVEAAQINHKGDGCFTEISYREVEVATNGWSEKKRLGEKGKKSFYHGKLNNTEVAIKRMKEVNHEELLILKNAKHKNILTLLNFIEGGSNPCLIYPFMKKGSLHDFLLSQEKSSDNHQTTVVLSWPQRLKLTIGIGEALSYLHNLFDHAVVIKSSDVFLDDSMNPVIGDICPPSMLDKRPSDHLRLYLPRRKKGNSENFDSFCVGTILLELGMGKPAPSFNCHPEDFLKPMPTTIEGLPYPLKGPQYSLKKFDLDRRAGNISEEHEQLWKSWILFCLNETTQINQITQSLQEECSNLLTY